MLQECFRGWGTKEDRVLQRKGCSRGQGAPEVDRALQKAERSRGQGAPEDGRPRRT